MGRLCCDFDRMSGEDKGSRMMDQVGLWGPRECVLGEIQRS